MKNRRKSTVITTVTIFAVPSISNTKKSKLPSLFTTISKYFSCIKETVKNISEIFLKIYENINPKNPHNIVDSKTGSINVLASIPTIENVPKEDIDTGIVDNVQLIVVNVYSLNVSPIFTFFPSRKFSILGDKYINPEAANIDSWKPTSKMTVGEKNTNKKIPIMKDLCID